MKELILRLYGENVPLEAIEKLTRTKIPEIINIVHGDLIKDKGNIELDKLLPKKAVKAFKG
jgi:hypothetical protein